MLPVGHTYKIATVGFSPDGKYVVTGSWDAHARIWETTTGRCVHDLVMQNGSVLHSEFSPDGRQLVASDGMGARIFNAITGELIHDLKGHTNAVWSARFSRNGKFVVTASSDGTAKIWDAANGKLLHTLAIGSALTDYLFEDTSAEFSSDGKYIVSCVADNAARVWDASTGKLLHKLISNNEIIWSALFSEDAKRIVTASDDGTAKLWDVNTGKPIQTLTDGADPVWTAEFSPDGKRVVTGGQTVNIWDPTSGKLLQKFSGYTEGVSSATFSVDGTRIVSTEFGTGSVQLWDAGNPASALKFDGHTGTVKAHFSNDGKYLVTAGGDGRAIVRETSNYKTLQTLGESVNTILVPRFSDDDRFVIARKESLGMESQTITLELSTGKVTTSPGFNNPEDAFKFSADGKYRIEPSGTIAKIIGVDNRQVLQTLTGHTAKVWTAILSRDGKYATTTSADKTAKIWDASNGNLLHNLTGLDSASDAAGFSPDGKYVAISNLGKLSMWEVSTGKKLHEEVEGYTVHFTSDSKYYVTEIPRPQLRETSTGKLKCSLTKDEGVHYGANLKFSHDGKYLILSEGPKLVLYDVENCNELLTWITFEDDWLVTHASGLFDASPGAMDKLYFVQNLDVIDFAQLKERYYEPGLWKKVMMREQLRDVTGMKSIDLPPDIRVGEVDEKGYLPIELINRGGGIGEVAIYLQGKEIEKDARASGSDPNAKGMKINYYIGNHKALVKGENYIGVKAWNKDHWVESRAKVISFTRGVKETYQPAVHIIASGISDYAGGNDIDLTYAAKDAEDMSKALKVGASRLFGVNRSYVYSLTTLQPKASWPTKKNIIQAFKKVSESAHPLDVIVVYLSGHGIASGGADGDWHYLTQEAFTTNASSYNDPAIRQQVTLSSSELADLFKTVSASKQVLIIDACAAGKIVDNLIVKKDVPASTLRALDRMKDRVGTHIITGCTADAVSYEASKYGQGVLTYSLLEGIRGAALRDEEFVDVTRLFHYAQDRVPLLAEGIGGVQTPMVFSPNGSQSFDIGQLSEKEKKDIPISRIRPVYIQSNFQDEDEMSDVISLGKKVDQSLGESASRGADAPVIFVPVREYPEGCQLVGRYKREGGTLMLKLRKKCDGKDITMDLSDADVNELAKKVAAVAVE